MGERTSGSSIKYMSKDGEERVATVWSDGPIMGKLSRSTWVRDDGRFVLVGMNRSKEWVEALALQPGERAELTKNGEPYAVRI